MKHLITAVSYICVWSFLYAITGYSWLIWFGCLLAVSAIARYIYTIKA